MVGQRSRVYGSREIVFYRICYLLLPFLCLFGAWALQDWYILFFSPFVLLNLFVILPRHHRRQILGRPPD